MNIAGVAQAQSVFTETTDDLWSTAGNWSAGVPDDTTDADITAGGDAVIDATTYTELAPAEAKIIKLLAGSNTSASGGRLTVAEDAFLDATRIWSNGKQSRLYNYGTIDLTGNLDWDGNKAEAYNYATGTINATGNLIVDVNGANSFNNAGAFTGASLVGDGTLNLTGGDMAFASETFLTTDGGTLNVTNDGQLTIAGDYAASYKLLVGTQITGITADKIVYDSVNNLTIVNVPEPATYAFFAGCLGLAWVMLRRGRS